MTDTPSKTVEAVARAIHINRHASNTMKARAAIKAYTECLMEPSEEMMEAGDAAIVEGMVRAKSGQPPLHPTHASHEIFQAMLSAKEKT